MVFIGLLLLLYENVSPASTLYHHTVKVMDKRLTCRSLPWLLMYCWRLILDKSEGFMCPGVERLNDLIKTYLWVTLGNQALTCIPILRTGMTFDVQKQFLGNIEEAISSPVDLPSVTSHYQDVLQYAGSKVNFVFGIGLYMTPD